MAGMVHLRLPGFSPIVPSFGLIAVYYWAIHRPGLMPSWAVFLIGLIQDLLGGGPLGVTVMVLLLMCAVIAAQRRFLVTGSFVLVWAVFLPMAAAVFTVSWLLHGLLMGTLSDVRPAVFQYLTTVAVYPCCAWLFARAQRALLR